VSGFSAVPLRRADPVIVADILPKERLNGDKTAVFETWFECSICHGRVAVDDRFCRHCGALFR
jgi:hypothetical protein